MDISNMPGEDDNVDENGVKTFLDIPVIFAIYDPPAADTLSGERELGFTLDIDVEGEDFGILDGYREVLEGIFAEAGFWTSDATETEYPIHDRVNSPAHRLWNEQGILPASLAAPSSISGDDARDAVVALNHPMIRFDPDFQARVIAMY